MRSLVAALTLAVFLTTLAAPAAADMRAFRASDGSEDPGFVRLGARTRVNRVIPDGSRGVYLIGRIIVNGGAQQMVHLKRDGSIAHAFRPSIRGGNVDDAALRGHELALIGTFRSIDGHRRRRVAVVDAHTGQTLPWKPRLPPSAGLYAVRGVVFAGRMLIVSTDGGLFAWRKGAAQIAWTRAFPFAPIAAWRGAIWTVVATPQLGARLASIRPASGRTHLTLRSMAHVSALQTIAGRLLALRHGIYRRVDDPNDPRLASCLQADGGPVAVAVAGDARTLYLGNAPVVLDPPGRLRAVTACPWAGGSAHFASPSFAYSSHGPIVTAIALVGTRVLVFTRRL
jgi:hypothetical protein